MVNHLRRRRNGLVAVLTGSAIALMFSAVALHFLYGSLPSVFQFVLSEGRLTPFTYRRLGFSEIFPNLVGSRACTVANFLRTQKFIG